MSQERSDIKRTDSIEEVDFIANSVSKSLPMPEEWTMSEFKQKEISGVLSPEPLLQADKTRFVLFPIKQPDVSDFDILLSEYLDLIMHVRE